MKKNKEFVMSDIETETSIRHCKNNIIRSVVLMKRVLNTLDYADKSLEGTDNLVMIQDIGYTRDDITDAIGRMEKYIK